MTSAKYRFIEESGSFEGQVYGIAITGNAQGIVYNKKVFTKAGITVADDAGRVPGRPPAGQGQARRGPAVHQLQGRLADLAVGAATA